MAGCEFGCDYCDQPEARRAPRRARVETFPGRRSFESLLNPLSAEEVARAVLRLQSGGLHRALALTGGEPLMQAGFLAALLPLVRGKGLKIFLETNGARPAELRALLPLLDIVSMDFKLRSATGRPTPVKRHAEFLALAVRRAWKFM